MSFEPPPLPPRRPVPPPPVLAPPPPPPPLLQPPPGEDVGRRMKANVVAAFEDNASGEGDWLFNGTMILFCLTIVLLPFGLFGLWSNRRDGQDAKAMLAFARGAEPVMAFPLMVNTMLRQPGDATAPGLVLIGFGPAGERMDLMADVAVAVGEGTADDPADAAVLIEMMADEEFTLNRRRAVPPRVARGEAIYACDLMMSQLLMVDHHLSDEMPLVPCLAEPGPAGRIMQVPWWLLAGQPAPDGKHKRAALELAAKSVRTT